ncbi:hypothetical protein [Shewanella maritima]|uniref:hypothetical protein n=1 Tax=Shewanella maritima TaxID=2520507 RepID=UPI003736DB0A
MTTTPQVQPTLTEEPSQPWDHVSETIKLLILSMAQIELSLSDGDKNVAGLGQLFTDMATHQTRVNQYLQSQDNTPEDIVAHGQQLADKVNEGVVAFQFYDRISQRLQHVTTGLALTEEVLKDEQKRIDEQAWQQVKQEIMRSYSLECEKYMFECVLKGIPLHEALAEYMHKQQPKSAEDDDIELF